MIRAVRPVSTGAEDPCFYPLSHNTRAMTPGTDTTPPEPAHQSSGRRQ